MHALIVRFHVRADQLADFDVLLADTIAQIDRHEPGTLVYAVAPAADGRDDDRVLIEVYRDAAAFDAHEAQPHTQRFLAEREHMLRSFSVEVLPVVSGLVR